MALSIVELHPSELIFHILEKLDIRDIFKFCKSSPILWSYWNDNYLWKNLLHRDFNLEELNLLLQNEFSKDIYYFLFKKKSDERWLRSEDGQQWIQGIINPAIEAGNLNLVKYFANDLSNISPVLLAIDKDQLEIVDNLLRLYYSSKSKIHNTVVIKLMEKKRYTNFIIKHLKKIEIDEYVISAAYDNGYRNSVVIYFLKKEKIKDIRIYSMILVIAIIRCDKEVVEKIFDKLTNRGRPVSSFISSDFLMLYGIKGGDIEIMEKIMKIDVFYPTLGLPRPIDYNWGLAIAAGEGKEEMVKFFLNPRNYIVDLDICADQYTSPLINAVRGGHLKIVKILLNKIGSNLGKNDYRKALNYAQSNGFQKVVETLTNHFESYV